MIFSYNQTFIPKVPFKVYDVDLKYFIGSFKVFTGKLPKLIPFMDDRGTPFILPLK